MDTFKDEQPLDNLCEMARHLGKFGRMRTAGRRKEYPAHISRLQQPSLIDSELGSTLRDTKKFENVYILETPYGIWYRLSLWHTSAAKTRRPKHAGSICAR